MDASWCMNQSLRSASGLAAANSGRAHAAACLGPRVQAADSADVHVAGDEADAQAARARQVLQPLDEGLALLQVRGRVPVVQRVIQLHRAALALDKQAQHVLPVQEQRAARPDSRQEHMARARSQPTGRRDCIMGSRTSCECPKLRDTTRAVRWLA